MGLMHILGSCFAPWLCAFSNTRLFPIPPELLTRDAVIYTWHSSCIQLEFTQKTPRWMHPMKPVTKATLLQVSKELACHPCTEREIDELVTPSMGIISGFQDLLLELEKVRSIALGDTPPASQVQQPARSDHA